MPQLSGYDIFKQMKQIKPSLKVVVVSGFSDHDEITLMLNEGASAFLQKPYSIKELDTIIKKCLS
jgi:DNA-binding NtrC family response regulator